MKVIVCAAALVLGLLQVASAQGEDGPSYFAVTLELTLDDEENMTSEEQQALAGHVQHLIDLYDAGQLYMGGPFESDDDDEDAADAAEDDDEDEDDADDAHRGLCIVLASSEDEAEAFFDEDPSVQAGYMEVVSVDRWWVAFSKPEGRSMTMQEFAQMMMEEKGGE
jgi:uncharacterized protein YciI